MKLVRCFKRLVTNTESRLDGSVDADGLTLSLSNIRPRSTTILLLTLQSLVSVYTTHPSCTMPPSQHLTGFLRSIDILDGFKEVKVATAYSIDGKMLEYFPANLDTLTNVEVVYKTMPGWQEPTTGAKTYNELPENARNYIAFIENYVGVKISYIGTGPGRESMIIR